MMPPGFWVMTADAGKLLALYWQITVDILVSVVLPSADTDTAFIILFFAVSWPIPERWASFPNCKAVFLSS